jgi:hypothetical protein
MKTKAQQAGHPFAWEGFETFYDSMLRIAPADYSPDTHRFRFKLDERGYCPETMSIRRKRGETQANEAAPLEVERREAAIAQLAAEISMRLSDDDAFEDLDDLVRCALEQVIL